MNSVFTSSAHLKSGRCFFIFHQCAAQDPCDRRTRALISNCCKFQQVKVRFVVQGNKNDYNFCFYPTHKPVPSLLIIEAQLPDD